MNNKDLMLAVWMVAYNHEDYIEQAIESVMMQKTNFKYKLFIGEDCSKDKTKIICYKLKVKYSDKIEIVYNNVNLGGNKNAINVYNLCHKSGAKYMALLEADDYWTDSLKLQKQVDFLEKNIDYGICFHPVSIYNELENKIVQDYFTRQVDSTTTIIDLAHGNFIHTPSVVLRNDFVIPYWFSKASIGDWTLYMIAIKNRKIKKLPDCMAVYRVHEASLWSSKSHQDRVKLTLQNIILIKENLKEINHEIISILNKRIDNYSIKSTLNISFWFYKIKRKLKL